MSSKKQKGGAAKERDKKKIKLQIAAQSCHSILQLFKKSTEQNSNTSTCLVSVFIILMIFDSNHLFKIYDSQIKI